MTDLARHQTLSSHHRSGVVLDSLSIALTTVVLTLVALSAPRPRMRAAPRLGSATGAGTVRLVPSVTQMVPGESADVEIWLDGVEDYYGIDVRIGFDPSVVDVPDGLVTPIWDLFDPSNHWIIRNRVNDQAGEAWYAVTNHNPAEPFEGAGRICRITFQAVITGSTTLDVRYARGSTHLGQTLEPERVGAEITVGAPEPEPHLESLNPSSALAGTSGLALTTEGAGFVDGAVVNWATSDRPTTFISSTRLTADLSAHDLAEAGIVSVTVVNPLPAQAASNALTFTVTNPAPTLMTLDPLSATVGTSGLTLCVTGRGFVHDSTVLWNGEPRATTRISSTLLNASIPPDDLVADSTIRVTVFNPPPGGGTSNDLFFVVRKPQPTPWTSAVYLPVVASAQ